MIVWITALLACAGAVESSTCDAVCDELYTACAYAAFPSRESCMQGCLYDQEERSVPMGNRLKCYEAAECDTFRIIECSKE